MNRTYVFKAGLVCAVALLLFSGCNKNNGEKPINGENIVKYAIDRYFTVRDLKIEKSEQSADWVITLLPEKNITLQSSPAEFLSLAAEHGEDGNKDIILTRPAYSVPVGLKSIKIMDGADKDLTESFTVVYQSLFESIKSKYFGGDNTIEKSLSEASSSEFNWMEDGRFILKKKDPSTALTENIQIVLTVTGGKTITRQLP